MTSRTRTLALTALALIGVLTLGACTTTPVEPAAPGTSTASPRDALTVIADVTDRASSVATSAALYQRSPVVVLAPTGDTATQSLAARAAVALGVPLLVGPANNADGDSAPAVALTGEINRLEATTVIMVGGVGEVSGGESFSAPEFVRVDATIEALSSAIGVPLDAPVAAGGTPAPTAAPATPAPAAPVTPLTVRQIAALTPGAMRTPTEQVPSFTLAAPLSDTLAMAIDAPVQLASVATARAAGAQILMVASSGANPQNSPEVIAALTASTTTQTLALGALYGAQPSLAWKVRTARTGVTLPGGGQTLFPAHQFVALYGVPGVASLGALGEQDAAASVVRVQKVAAPFQELTAKTVVPMFEIIATVAAANKGEDGNYSNELDPAQLKPYIDAATAAGMYVVLDLQPGRTNFLTQAMLYEEFLVQPNVGLALDPEWRLKSDEVHLEQIGSVTAAEVNEVSAWLAELTSAHNLPQKMLVLHQFRVDMIEDRASLVTTRPEVAVVLHADGQGSQEDKKATWEALHVDAPAGVAWGWKNFYDEDSPSLTPRQTAQRISPSPDLVTFQ